MPSKLGRVIGGVLGTLLLGSTLLRALFDAYGHVGQFLGILPEGLQKFIASANGTVFLIVAGLALLWWAIREQRMSGDEATSLRAENGRLQNEIEAMRTGASPDDWHVHLDGRVADIRVLDQTFSRYAIAVGVEITNRSAVQISLTAQMFMQWGHECLSLAAPACQSNVPRWEEVLRAFDLPNRQQLIFPLTLDRGHVSGHVVFEIPDVGVAVKDMEALARIGGLDTDSEAERERDCYVRFTDKISGELPKQVPVYCVYAPQLDGLGVARPSDLAVRGNAATWTPR